MKIFANFIQHFYSLLEFHVIHIKGQGVTIGLEYHFKGYIRFIIVVSLLFRVI